MEKDRPNLSRSMEDYLEAIYNLQLEGKAARVRDIAAKLGVKMPSVTGALRLLAERGLVLHKPYEQVELTEEGLKSASGVAQRHSAVKHFLVNTLGLEDADAEREACALEHAISPDTLDKLVKSVDRGPHRWRRGRPRVRSVPLSNLGVGGQGRVASLTGRGPIRKRLMEMGFTPGARVEVIRTAPLGDPIEVRVRGYLLSLRKSEADIVEVETQ